MILEGAMLNVRLGQAADFEAAFALAKSIISTMPDYISHELHRCVDANNKYLLLVRWHHLEDHTEGFRKSVEYQE